MKFFRETTTGKVIVMGRKTLESFPEWDAALKTGSILCLSRDRNMKQKCAVSVHDEDELMNELGKYDT